ncbi:hypothetical protein VTN31DRAFT_3600 [Thermomyces dupontii]|uniref:uncharacterized protein n=1 Tax=Talaromyces thermophilus TaxID=28565 RepID=UPI003742E7FB
MQPWRACPLIFSQVIHPAESHDSAHCRVVSLGTAVESSPHLSRAFDQNVGFQMIPPSLYEDYLVFIQPHSSPFAPVRTDKRDSSSQTAIKCDFS